MTDSFAILMQPPDFEADRARCDFSDRFFRSCLDPRMCYSWAYFATGRESLEEAQVAKIRPRSRCPRTEGRRARRLLAQRSAYAGEDFPSHARHVAALVVVRVRRVGDRLQDHVVEFGRSGLEGVHELLRYLLWCPPETE